MVLSQTETSQTKTETKASLSQTETNPPFSQTETETFARYQHTESVAFDGHDRTSNTVRIQWKSNDYTVPEPPRVESFVCFMEKVHNKVDFAGATRPTKEEKQKLVQLEGLVVAFLTELYHRGWQWTPCSLKSSHNVSIYLLNFRAGLKIGMSTRTWLRVKEQDTKENPVLFAAKLVDRNDLASIVPQHYVDQIAALSLPGLCFHADHQEHLHDLIRLQLVELFLACFYKCVTKTVGERLTQLPSPYVRDITSTTLSKPPNGAVGFLEGIGDGEVVFIHTWPTLWSRLHEMANGLELTDSNDRLLLQRVLRPLPPMGGYVTANRFMELFGPKFGSCKNCLNYSPRETEVRTCVVKLHGLLQHEVDPTNKDQCAAIRQALAPIQGDNYSSYVRPSIAELAACARPLLEQHLTELPVRQVVVLERWTVQAVQKEYGSYWQATIDKTSEILLLPKEYGLSFVRAKTGHRIILTPSFFLMFAEKVQTVVRFRIVKAYLKLLQLLQLSGNVTAAHADNLRRILRSFLMGLEFGQSDTLFANAEYL